MNSYNHYAYGAVADWIYRYAAGVDATPLDAGFHTVVLHPVFNARLGSISFDYASAYGPIHSDWKFNVEPRSGTSPSPPTPPAGCPSAKRRPRNTNWMRPASPKQIGHGSHAKWSNRL